MQNFDIWRNFNWELTIVEVILLGWWVQKNSKKGSGGVLYSVAHVGSFISQIHCL